MSKTKKIAIIIICSMFLFCLVYYFYYRRSANIEGNENGEFIRYDGVEYSSDHFFCADDDRKYIGVANNGAAVYTIGPYEPPKFILIEGSDNSRCFSAKDAKVPTSGKVTKVLVDPGIRANNEYYLSSEEELAVVSKLSDITGEVQEFEVYNYYTDGNDFYYVYDDSNLSCSKNYGGYIAFIDGKWIYSSPKEDETFKRIKDNTYKFSGVVIDDEELISALKKTDLVKHIEKN